MKKIFLIILTPLIFASCSGSEIERLSQQVAEQKLRNEELTNEIDFLRKQVSDREYTISEREIALADKNKEIEALKLSSPHIYFEAHIKGNEHDCKNVTASGNIFIQKFGKEAPNGKRVSQILSGCETKKKIEAYVISGKLSQAKSIAKTVEEQEFYNQKAQEYGRYGKLMGKINEPDGYVIYSILKEDVLAVFNLEKRYDTPLKVKAFEGSEEYRNKLDTLRELKKMILNKRFSIEYKNAFKGSYDMSIGGFKVKFGAAAGFGTYGAKPPRSYNRFYFPDLEFSYEPPYSDYPSVKNTYLIVKIDETLGARIEKNPEQFSLYLHFNIEGTAELPYEYLSIAPGSSGGRYEIQGRVVRTKNSKVEVRQKGKIETTASK